MANVPSRTSWSQVSSFLDCGKRYELERLIKVPSKPAVWFPAGTAFHKATEDYDLGVWDGSDIQAKTDAELLAATDEEQLKAPDLPLDQWSVGGRGAETLAWWAKALPGQVEAYLEWRATSFYEIANVYTFNPGVSATVTPAVELALDYDVDGIPVTGYLDRLLVSPTGEAVIADLKTGSRTPPGGGQLGFYKVALKKQYDIDVTWGSYYMSRNIGEYKTGPQKGKPKHPFTEPKLLYWGEQQVVDVVRQYRRAVEADVFIPNESDFCKACGVAAYCAVRGGALAAGVDPLADTAIRVA